MLSRLAEAFYWIGRYLERAEATARLLAEHYHLTVEDRSVPEDIAAAVVLDALSLPHDVVISPTELVRALLGDVAQPLHGDRRGGRRAGERALGARRAAPETCSSRSTAPTSR